MSSSVSFAQNLQSELGQRVIMFRVESELKVLEVLKKFLLIQIRLEKDYSNSIENAALAAAKTIKSVLTDVSNSNTKNKSESNLNTLGSNSTNESIVTRACGEVLIEVQNDAKKLRENSEKLNLNTLKNLNELISEKKSLLKSAQEEYSRVKGRLDALSEKVKKQKADYFTNFKSYENARTKFEEICSKPKGSQKNAKKHEDSRDKFTRMRKKLNMSHAEYLLGIQEVTVYDRDFRTILLPSLLQIEQTWCEKQLTIWTSVLEDISNFSSMSPSTKTKLKEFEFTKEYMELISKHKSPPLQPIDIKFQPALMSSQPVTQAYFVIDADMIEFLRQRICDIEKNLRKLEADFSNCDNKGSNDSKNKNNLESDFKKLELLIHRSEIDRLKYLKSYIENSLKGREANAAKDETISLISEQSGRKLPANRLSSFFKNAAAFTKKAVSFDEESQIQTNDLSEKSSYFDPDGASTSYNNLIDEEWFHGVLPREDVVRLLKIQGDYLVRETIKNEERQLVLSVYWNGPKHFIIQKTGDGQFRFEGPIFLTVKDLLQHYLNSKLPITNRSGSIIKNAIKKEKWELNNDDLELIEKIGKGNFGDVYKASLNGVLVAVKTCKTDLPEEQKRKFLQEARILKQYDHPNIVKFVGICVQKQPIMIVMELVPGGSLLTYLKKNGVSLKANELVKICLDVASGMKYLEERSCLHRDLAARNCLIDTGGSIKISDFGMSREEHEYVVSDGLKQIPIKWTAPEALNYGKYTSLSDVWSYGILVWEVFSSGSTPYPAMTNSKAREMIEAGYRLTSPPSMPDVIYSLVSRCWMYEPEQRPRFTELYAELIVISNSDLI